MDYLVGVGEYFVTNDPEGIIKTYSLSTCLAVVIYCPTKKTMGILHAQLPDSSIDPCGSKNRPGRFVDTGLERMLQDFQQKYSCCSRSLNVSIFGGFEALGKDRFLIGQRNIYAVKNILKQKNLRIGYEDIGGQKIRTIFAMVNNGNVEVYINNGDKIAK